MSVFCSRAGRAIVYHFFRPPTIIRKYNNNIIIVAAIKPYLRKTIARVRREAASSSGNEKINNYHEKNCPKNLQIVVSSAARDRVVHETGLRDKETIIIIVIICICTHTHTLNRSGFAEIECAA